MTNSIPPLFCLQTPLQFILFLVQWQTPFPIFFVSPAADLWPSLIPWCPVSWNTKSHYGCVRISGACVYMELVGHHPLAGQPSTNGRPGNQTKPQPPHSSPKRTHRCADICHQSMHKGLRERERIKGCIWFCFSSSWLWGEWSDPTTPQLSSPTSSSPKLTTPVIYCQHW